MHDSCHAIARSVGQSKIEVGDSRVLPRLVFIIYEYALTSKVPDAEYLFQVYFVLTVKVVDKIETAILKKCTRDFTLLNDHKVNECEILILVSSQICV